MNVNQPPDVLAGYPVRSRPIPVAGRTYSLLGPANFEALIDDPRVAARFQRDEYMPYWAEFWPACLPLAELVAAWGPADPAAPPRVLEFGCGLGLVGLVAAGLGYQVTMSDYDDDALDFVRESARRNEIALPETRYLDWRERYPELQFDRIVAAEVLYEKRNLEPIAAFIAAHLAPGGLAVLCDRNRATADPFSDVAALHDLRVRVEAVSARYDFVDPPEVRARLFHIRRGDSNAGSPI